MRDIPFLERLGDEFERVAREESARRGASALSRVGAALAGITGVAALLLIWGPYFSPGETPQAGATEQSEIRLDPTGVELLTASFESIVAELDWAQVGEIGTEIGQAGGPYPRDVLVALGADFNVLHVPTYLPKGYSLYGKLRAGGGFDRAPRIQTQVLNYDDWGFFIIDQFAKGFTPSAIKKPGENTVEVEGFRLYVRRMDSEHVVYFFERDGTWFDIIVGRSMDAPGLGPGDVARTAMSLVAVESSGWGDSQAVVPTVSVFSGVSDEDGGDASRNGGRRCSAVSRLLPVSPIQDTPLTHMDAHAFETRISRRSLPGEVAVHPAPYEHGGAPYQTAVGGPILTHV